MGAIILCAYLDHRPLRKAALLEQGGFSLANTPCVILDIIYRNYCTFVESTGLSINLSS
jgi:hypothetical protein